MTIPAGHAVEVDKRFNESWYLAITTIACAKVRRAMPTLPVSSGPAVLDGMQCSAGSVRHGDF